MEKSVFIVTAGSYSDYHVVAVYSTEEQAQQVAEKQYDGNWLELEIDPEEILCPPKHKLFDVCMLKNGSVRYTHSSNVKVLYNPDILKPELRKDWYPTQKDEIVLQVNCFAKTEKQAIKIANEKRSEIIALNRWELAHDMEYTYPLHLEYKER